MPWDTQLFFNVLEHNTQACTITIKQPWLYDDVNDN